MLVKSSGIYRSIPPSKIWTKKTHRGKTKQKLTFCLRRFFRLTEVEPNCSFTMTFYFQFLSLDWFSRWWQLQYFWNFHPEPWGRFPFWLIFFRWVETTNQLSVGLSPRLGEAWLRKAIHNCLADDGQKKKTCQACALPRSHTVKEHACQRFQISTPGGTPLVPCLVPPCQRLLNQHVTVHLYNLYTDIVRISLLLLWAKVVTCKAFCQPIGVVMSTRHDGFGIIQWQQPKTGLARSMNFGEVPSGRVFSRTLPPQQILAVFGHEFWMIRTWWGCSLRIIATVQHHIILSMWTTRKAGRERLLLSQRNLCLALLFRLIHFSYHPLLLSGTFWCLLLSSHFAVEFNGLCWIGVNHHMNPKMYFGLFFLHLATRCILAGPSNGYHSTRFFHGRDRPLWTNVAHQLSQEGGFSLGYVRTLNAV